MELESMDAVSKFFRFVRRTSKILFIVDQMNALEELDSVGTDDISNEEKKDLLRWIHLCAAKQKYIFSTSANYKTQFRMDIKQTNEGRLLVYGGLSAVSPYSTIC